MVLRMQWVAIRGAEPVLGRLGGAQTDMARGSRDEEAGAWRTALATSVTTAREFARSPGFDATLAAAFTRRFAGGTQVQAPVTIAWGQRDLLLPPWQARRASRALPSARVVRLVGCGHVPMLDAPQQVVAVLLAVVAASAAGP
jgi:pimeloyl-ACP methyl ester carboxylesterase